MCQFFVLDLCVLLHIASKQPASISSAGHSTMRPCGDAAVPHTDSSAGQKLKHLIPTLKLFVWPLQTALLYANMAPRGIWPSQCRAVASVRKVISNAKSRRSDTRLRWHRLRGGGEHRLMSTFFFYCFFLCALFWTSAEGESASFITFSSNYTAFTPKAYCLVSDMTWNICVGNWTSKKWH